MRPTFEQSIEYVNNHQPSRVNARLVSRGGQRVSDLTRMATISTTLYTYVQQAVRNHTGWTAAQTRRRVSGYLVGVNMDNSNNGISRRIGLSELTRDLFESVMEAIHESNADINVIDIEWGFIIDSTSYNIGGSSNVTIPEYLRKTRLIKPAWENHEYNNQQINCAAFSIEYMMNNRKHNYYKNIKLAEKNAYDLSKRLGWEKVISISQLKSFVDNYPKWRISAICPAVSDQSQYTFEGKDWEYPNNIIYLVYDATQHHFAAITAPLAIIKKFRHSPLYKFCDKCMHIFPDNVIEHVCGDLQPERKKRKVTCHHCGIYGEHSCPKTTCWTCGTIYEKYKTSEKLHRCIIYKKPEKKIATFEDMGKVKSYTGAPELWAFDFESRMLRIENTTTLEFQSEEGQYIIENGTVQTITVEKSKHIVNMVVFQRVYGDTTPIIYYGDNALDDFIRFMMDNNNGNNICVAHNASGYDNRLLLEHATIIANDDIFMTPIARGTKFMQLKIGQGSKNKNGKGNATYFRDSLLHVKGSLKALAKDFLGTEEKGFFPHLFNTEENRNYVGPIPAKHYFDMVNCAKNQKDIDDFNEWHDSQKGSWNFMEQLKKYCVQDVNILRQIMAKYDEPLVEKFGLSPWMNATSPSYVHELFLRKLSDNLDLPAVSKTDDLRFDKIQELSDDKFWAALVPNEYWFARLALRGGRTEVRKIYHQISQQDWDRGVRIRYQDIVSMYPYVQTVCDFPVGTTLVEIYDTKYYPCYKHRNESSVHCGCSIPERFSSVEKKMAVMIKPKPTVQEILSDEKFFGIVCASLTPPTDLFHPVLVAWDEKLGKSIGSLEPIIAGTFTSIEFKKALQHGYRLDAIHRFDRYTKAPSLWADILKELFIEKMANAESTPSLEKQQALIDGYEEFFDMGDMVKNSFPWSSNPARKQTAKIMLNSGWGKHAERVIMPEVKIINSTDIDAIDDIFENCSKGNSDLQDMKNIGLRTWFKFKNTSNPNPNLHKAYLPAGVFVPAYGRMMLWDQLNKLGKRVLMHDTDSIIYIYDPLEYNIPKGDIWGQWDVEKIDYKNGGIKTFIGLGPKSYALKAANDTTLVKLKGVSLKNSTTSILNFDTLEEMITNFISTQESSEIDIPQMTFRYVPSQGMTTNYYLKKVKFQKDDLKGILIRDTLYPFGFNKLLF